MKSTLQTFVRLLPKDNLVIIHGNSEILRNGDVYFPFRQSSDFLYLTELDIPDLILTIHNNNSILWRDPITEKEILWGHNKLSDIEIMTISGISDIRDRSLFNDYYNGHSHDILSFDKVMDIIHTLRIIKNPLEIQNIQTAIEVTKKAFREIDSIIHPGMYEYQIEAEIARIFRSHHMIEAYPSIVASGPNSCVLHYTKHSRQLLEGDVLLIDAGAEYMGYASDMTRTFSVGSQFSSRQQEIYDAVCRVKTFAENTLKPGILFLEYEKSVRSYMNHELMELGLIPSGVSTQEQQELSRKYYPHRTSHFLGLDVHDVGPRDILLQVGMVVTIEPGIYILEENIGIRIEDDYRITDTSCECLG